MGSRILVCVCAASLGCSTRDQPLARSDLGVARESTTNANAGRATEAEPRAFRAALARGIRPSGRNDATYRVDSFVVTYLFEWLTATEGRPIFSPIEAAGGGLSGYRVVSVEPGSVWAVLGFASGDRIEELAGVPLRAPGDVAQAWEQVRNRVTVKVVREEVSRTLSYEVEDGLAWASLSSNVAQPDSDTFAEKPTREPSKSNLRPVTTPHSVPRRPARPDHNRRPTASSPPPSAGADSVRCSSPSQCTVAKRTFDAYLAAPQRLQSGVDIVPAIRNDLHSGYKFKRVSKQSPLYKLGFRAGDKVTHVNRYDLTNDLHAMSLYSGLRSTRTFRVRYERSGRSRVRTITVQ